MESTQRLCGAIGGFLSYVKKSENFLYLRSFSTSSHGRGRFREMPVSIALLKNDDDPIISADQEQRELDQVDRA